MYGHPCLLLCVLCIMCVHCVEHAVCCAPVCVVQVVYDLTAHGLPPAVLLNRQACLVFVVFVFVFWIFVHVFVDGAWWCAPPASSGRAELEGGVVLRTAVPDLVPSVGICG